MSTLTKLEIQNQLSISATQVNAAIKAAGLEDKSVYSQEECDRILEAASNPTRVQKPSKRSPNSDIQPRTSDRPIKSNAQNASDILLSRQQRGVSLGAQAAMAEVKGFTDGYMSVTDAFYSQFNELTAAEIEHIDAIDVESAEVDVQGLLANFFDPGAIALIESQKS